MAKFEVRLSARAKRDVTQFYSWICERSDAGADSWYEAFLSSLRRIESNPAAYSQAPEGRQFKQAIRQAVFKTTKGNPYRILFEVDGETVNILCVRGKGQPPVRKADLD